MAETFSASYVSLHVRVSNIAALKLYRDTLGFQVEKTEAKYYADGEDAFSMKMDLTDIKNAFQESLEDASAGAEDEGDEVGSAGKAEGKKKGAATGEKKRKVKVGRGLGVAGLVERNESKAT